MSATEESFGGAPAFAALITLDAGTAAYDAAHQSERAYANAALQAAHAVVLPSVTDKIRASHAVFAIDVALPALTKAFGFQVEGGSLDEQVVLAMAARDLAWRWLRPQWRLGLSYRQLVQSRQWARRLTVAGAQALTQDVCGVEAVLQRANDTEIAQRLTPTFAHLQADVAKQVSAHAAPAVHQQIIRGALREVLLQRVLDVLDAAAARVAQKGTG